MLSRLPALASARANLGTERGPAAATLRNLVRARWALIVCVIALAVAVLVSERRFDAAAMGLPRATHAAAFVIALVGWGALNAATQLWLDRRSEVGRGLAGLHLVGDVVVITILLAASGAASNPFTALYFVPITLATQISPRWAWGVGASAMLGFGVLLFVGPDVPAGPHAHHFAGHLRGMWIALGVSGSVLTYFVHRIALAREHERAELARLRREALEDRHLTALGTLAAGAAHELATPLGTIQVLAGELPHMEDEERAAAEASIRNAVGRCKAILSRMAAPELRVEQLDRNVELDAWPVRDVASELAQALGDAVKLDASGLDDCEVSVRLPRGAVVQVLRELVANAAHAVSNLGREGHVRVDAVEDGDGVRLIVEDDAGGLPAEAEERAVEPFFTTRDEGEGMGLGLYLVRAHVRQLGGRVTFDNRPGKGLVVEVWLPRAWNP